MKELKIKKSELNLRDAYDYARITMTRECFIPCSLTEEEEDIVLKFDMDGMKPIQEIREEKDEDKLLLLLDAMKLSNLMEAYLIELNPDNLYYDANHKIGVLMRDIYPADEVVNQKEILKKIKALCAFVLQKKYSYEDYYEGGMELLKRNKVLKDIYEKTDIDDLGKYLSEYREEMLGKKRKYLCEVRKSSYLTRGIMAVSFSVLSLLLLGFGIYYYAKIGRVQKTMLTADQYYIAGDSISMIEEMETLSIEQMDLEHKFILAQAYIKSEDLTTEQKENILAAFYLTSNEKMMEYWIHIGRLEVGEAENIAMQYSDDELLLYAYLKDKALTESNTLMDGTEKQQRLSDLDDKIEGLSETYTKELID